tara:strand:- start:300 stop:464 length:165 start_codon:yes stop_codon:yes gene_type:complete
VDRLDEILQKILEDIKMNPDVDVFCDICVEDLRGELIHNMGVNAHAAWKERNNA